MFPHRTHQNGTSVDFMTPLLKNEKKQKFYACYQGGWRARAYQEQRDLEGFFSIGRTVKHHTTPHTSMPFVVYDELPIYNHEAEPR